MARRSHQRRTQPKSQRPRAIEPRPPSTRSPADKRTRALWWAVAITALVLLLTVDDRYPGAIADGRQMAWTAIAITETGEIGQARGRDFTWPRTEGDAVSRYGMGMSLAQIPAAWMAPRIEARLGPGASQPLFLIVPLLCVCAAAAAAGWIALGLGLSAGGVAAAVLLTALGSPLGSYASLDLSEPLQSAALTLAVACALTMSHPNVTKRAALRCAFLAGPAADVAYSRNPASGSPPRSRCCRCCEGRARGARARILCALGGLAVPLAGWIHFEISRFGRLFASYGGEGFTHPLAGWILETARRSESGSGPVLSCARHRVAGVGILLSAAVKSSAARLQRRLASSLRCSRRSWMVGLAWALGMGTTAAGAGYPSSRGLCCSHPRSLASNGPIRASQRQHDSSTCQVCFRTRHR